MLLQDQPEGFVISSSTFIYICNVCGSTHQGKCMINGSVARETLFLLWGGNSYGICTTYYFPPHLLVPHLLVQVVPCLVNKTHTEPDYRYVQNTLQKKRATTVLPCAIYVYERERLTSPTYKPATHAWLYVSHAISKASFMTSYMHVF